MPLGYLGKYELVRKLAEGGMAEVFLGQMTGPGGFTKPVVLKRIRKSFEGNERMSQMLLEEARATAPLSHPNLVQIFDIGEDGGTYFIAMEYVDGYSLRAPIVQARERGLELSIAAVVRLLAEACEGLSYAHDFADPITGERVGLIHRDVSPENILLSRSGNVKVTDFGIAKSAATASPSAETKQFGPKGKVSYMAPEQLRKQPLDARVDVYALGVVAFELLTLQKPMPGKSDVAAMIATLKGPRKPPSVHREDIPASLDRIVLTALEVERDRRFRSCREMLRALRDVEAELPRRAERSDLADLIDLVEGEDPRTVVSPAAKSAAKSAVERTDDDERPTNPVRPSVSVATTNPNSVKPSVGAATTGVQRAPVGMLDEPDESSRPTANDMKPLPPETPDSTERVKVVAPAHFVKVVPPPEATGPRADESRSEPATVTANARGPAQRRNSRGVAVSRAPTDSGHHQVDDSGKPTEPRRALNLRPGWFDRLARFFGLRR